MSCLEIRPSTRPLKILFSTIAALSASASSARLFFAASDRKLNRYLLFFCSSYAAASSALNTLPSTAFANRLFRIGFGRDAGSFSALSIVISFVFASSSAEISSFAILRIHCSDLHCDIGQSLFCSSIRCPEAATRTPILPPPWM